jgi:tetratricopeptide (TPR) repeat protein
MEFHALDLVGGTASRSEDETDRSAVALPQSEEELASTGIHVSSLGDAGELLDDQAKAAYRRRLAELREELEEAKERGNLERAAQTEEEIEALMAELSRAVGLSGRDRRAASAAERARQSVSRALKTVVDRITEHDPALGALFSRCIKTGTFCSYHPDLNFPIAWEFGAPIPDFAALPPDHDIATDPLGHERPERESSAAGELLTPLLSFANRTAFVGREAERSHLRNLIDRALSGQGALAMLGGGPGVGKTRLALEMADYASCKGFRFRMGRCYEREEPHPYLPFAEILEMALAQAPSLEEFLQGLGENAAEWAQIAPRLRRVFPDIPAPLELPPQQARRYLFQSLAESLARAARRVPYFLVLDDLQWADESTLALLHHLANRVAQIPVVIIGIYRDVDLDTNPALVRTLEELLRIGVPPINLRGLSHEAVAQMLHGLSRREPPAHLVRVIFEETQGNPFFVGEVYKHFVEEGKIFDVAGQFRADLTIDEVDVPRNVRLVLGRRLKRLGEQARQVLGAAAVIGRSFSFQLLEALLEQVDVDDLLTAIEEAQRMELIVSSSEGPEAPFTFAHELIRQTLLSDISLPRRQRLHVNVANVIERLSVSAVNDRAAEIAHHLVQAGSAADGRRVVHYLALAGKGALQAAAYEEALRHFESALSHREAIDSRQQAELLSHLAMTERSLGQWDEALAHWREALDIYISLGDRELIGSVSFEIVESLIWAGRYREAAQIADRGLAQLAGEVSPNRAHLLAAVGLINTAEGVHGPARDAFQEAVALAERLSDQKLLARILGYRSRHNFVFLQLQEAVADGLQSEELSHAEGSLWPRAQRLSSMQHALYHLGRVKEAARIGDELEPLARKIGHVAALSHCLRIQAWTEFSKAPDLTRLGQQLQQDLEINRTVKIQRWIAASQAQLSLVEFFRGNWEAGLEHAAEACRLELLNAIDGRPAFAQSEESHDQDVFPLFGAGTLFRQQAYAGDRAGALALLTEKRAKLPHAGEPNTLGSWAMLLLMVEGLVVLGEQEQAAALYPLVRQLLTTGAVCFAWIARFPQTIAGVAAAAAQHWDTAEEHFRLALQQAEHFPHRLEQAEIRRFCGAMLIDRGAPDDREKARKLLSEALARYTHIGMPRHSAITKALLAKLQH